jgi:Spy/CpxP family protein refolding chaperone
MKAISLASIVVVSMAGFCIAEAPSHGPAPNKQPSEIRLTQPWNKLTTLSDEQKTRLNEIYRKSKAEQKEIERRATAEMTGVLTPEQRAELRAIQDSETVERKLKDAPKEGKEEGPVLPAVEGDGRP